MPGLISGLCLLIPKSHHIPGKTFHCKVLALRTLFHDENCGDHGTNVKFFFGFSNYCRENSEGFRWRLPPKGPFATKALSITKF
jgi:hypothetical protein